MRIFLFILCAISLSGCKQNHIVRYVPTEKLICANEVRQKVAIKLKKEKNLHPCGTGGQMLHQIKMLYLAFDYYHELTIDEGRELLVYAMNEFLNEINADQKIRPYLDEYPFESKNVEIAIFLSNPDKSHPSLGKLVILKSSEGKLQYKIDDLETRLFKIVHSETFEEAVAKINLSKQKTSA